ncbi:hypothetical protein PC116_g20603 [Phytophthora cactorum]|nr:hypothetical protein Pcac1_g5670 [Phytophthora cactorum]KAG4231110.1 hypothetical protein PC116_g20603 [Phytophthora cactorum]
MTGRPVKAAGIHLEPLAEVSELLNLEEMAVDDFLADLKAGEIAEVMLLKPETTPEELNASSVLDEDVLEEMKKRREERLGSEVLKNPKDPVYPLVKEFADVVSKDPLPQLPPDRGVRHEIDLVPGTKYCVIRQWPLPREQCEVIDAFFAAKENAGMVRESKSPHLTPTFCVRKPNGKWRLVHAYNKLNNATVPAQTPIPRKDVLFNNMAGCEMYSALDLVDGYYQILMRESDIPLTAVSTPSGILWEWLVMPQGLSNVPATFNRLATQLFRPLRAYAQTYFDDIFVHSRAGDGKTAMEVHLGHLRRVLEVMRANQLYANIDKCVFASTEIKVLGCFVSNAGVRADPEKVKAVAAWPTPRSQKDLRKWLGLANYSTSTVRDTRVWLDPCRNFSKRIPTGAGSVSTRMPLKASRLAFSRRRSWRCRTRRSRSVSFAMPPTTQSVVRCCRTMQTDTNESYRSSPGNSRLPNETIPLMTRSCLP